MRSHSRFSMRTLAGALCGIALAAGVLGFRAQADQWDKRTILTVSQPIQVKETLLPAGQYVLKLLNSDSNRHVVQIFNSDQSQLINTVMAIPNYRLEPTGKSQFLFWETPRGTAKALRAWFYPGDNFGQEFPYPKHLAQLEAPTETARAVAPVPEPSTAAPPPAETAVTQPQSSTEESQRDRMEEPQRDRDAEEAQTAPTAIPAPPPQAAAQQSEQTPERLPKTASAYPMIGLLGLVSLSLYGLLRLKRSA
jgi:hypothetical protein